MRYKRGSIVEVFCYQSWRCARIVSDKGHYYTVSYDVYPGFTNEDDMECVPVKSIRPCPPQLEVSESWVPGDVAEVFHNLSWKMAIILKDFGLDQFLVRLAGSLHEFIVTKSELRVRQSYQNSEWIVINKVPRDYKDANSIKLSKYGNNSGFQAKQKVTKEDLYAKDLCFDTQNIHHLMESRIVSCKKQKRASTSCYSQDETNKKHARKLRKRENKGGQAWAQVTLHEKVYDAANGYESSSGSCSINSYKQYAIHHEKAGFVEDIEDHESDAESVCQFGCYKESQSQEIDESATKEAVADKIHRLELDAYRYTMTALHASGPLTWDKVTMGQSSDLCTYSSAVLPSVS